MKILSTKSHTRTPHTSLASYCFRLYFYLLTAVKGERERETRREIERRRKRAGTTATTNLTRHRHHLLLSFSAPNIFHLFSYAGFAFILWKKTVLLFLSFHRCSSLPIHFFDDDIFLYNPIEINIYLRTNKHSIIKLTTMIIILTRTCFISI